MLTNYRAAEGITVVALTRSSRIVLGAANFNLCANPECVESARLFFRERFPEAGEIDLVAVPLWEQMPAEGGGL